MTARLNLWATMNNPKQHLHFSKSLFAIASIIAVLFVVSAFSGCGKIKADTHEITLYFADRDAMFLHPEQRMVELTDGEKLEQVVIRELISGPASEHLYACVNGEFEVLSISTSDGICTVDFSGEFRDLNIGGSTKEAFAIGSIVNSLCALDGIDAVKINIDGNAAAEFGGHFTLEDVFYPNTSIVAEN